MRQILTATVAAAILAGKHEVKLSGVEGRRAVALICGIYDSARTGRTVKL